MAVVDLGISDERFWRLTPRQFRALCDRLAMREEIANRRAGMVPVEKKDGPVSPAMLQQMAGRHGGKFRKRKPTPEQGG